MAAQTTSDLPRHPRWLDLVGRVGEFAISMPAYLGGVALLMVSAGFSLRRPEADENSPGFVRLVVVQLSWMLAAGLPLVALVHVGMGSFLSMQAYFGSTFVDGTGAVVGVGLIRNLASLMTGMTLAGMLAVRMIPELLGLIQSNRDAREETGSVSPVQSTSPARHASRPPSRREPLSPGHMAAPRIVAAAVAGTLLSLWGTAVGTLVGWQASGTLLGLPSEMFFMMMARMIWFRDVVGLMAKGVIFGSLPAAICCFEGLRTALEHRETHEQSNALAASTADHVGAEVVRAACLGMISILIGNMAWFLLVYHAVPSYGPSLLAPPGP